MHTGHITSASSRVPEIMPRLGLETIAVKRVNDDLGAAAATYKSSGEGEVDGSTGGHSPPRVAILVTTVAAVIIVGMSLFWFVRWRTRKARYLSKYTRRQASTRTGKSEISLKKHSPPPTGKWSKPTAKSGLDWNPESTFAKPSATKPYVGKPYAQSQAMLSSSSIKNFWHNSIGASRTPKLHVRGKLSSSSKELEGLPIHHRDDSGGNPLLRETVTEIEMPPKGFQRALSTPSSSIFHLDRPSVRDRPLSTTSTLDQTPHNASTAQTGSMVSKYPWSPTTHITPIEPSYNSMTFFNHRESYGSSIHNIETTATTTTDHPRSHLQNS
ncbi:hypothetical protein MferCBS31731_000571 [Microsporum ferrugineum]